MRTCKRCGETKSKLEFAESGKICFTCKRKQYWRSDLLRYTAKRDYFQRAIDDLLAKGEPE